MDVLLILKNNRARCSVLIKSLLTIKNHSTSGTVLIDVLVALIIISVSLVVIFSGIAAIGKHASINKEKVMQLIENRTNHVIERQSEFYKGEN